MNQVAVNYVSLLIFHFQGHLRFYPVLPFIRVLPRFFPGFTQLSRVKLGKTVWMFYPPTLFCSVISSLSGNHAYLQRLYTNVNVKAAIKSGDSGGKSTGFRHK